MIPSLIISILITSPLFSLPVPSQSSGSTGRKASTIFTGGGYTGTAVELTGVTLGLLYLGSRLLVNKNENDNIAGIIVVGTAAVYGPIMIALSCGQW